MPVVGNTKLLEVITKKGLHSRGRSTSYCSFPKYVWEQTPEKGLLSLTFPHSLPLFNLLRSH